MVYANIKKTPVLSVPNALEVLNNKMGDCNEHAVLTAALLRAAGFPRKSKRDYFIKMGAFIIMPGTLPTREIGLPLTPFLVRYRLT
jgi:transglutaminase-like putative cysteine protease